MDAGNQFFYTEYLSQTAWTGKKAGMTGRSTLITAPAGSGKTTAAVSYLTEAGLSFAWLSLDENDNDPVRFWRYIVAALQGQASSGKIFWEIPVRQELINANIQADLVLDKLYTLPGKTVLVLDDYHLIENQIIHSSLSYFLKYLPAHFHIKFTFLKPNASGNTEI